MKIAVYHNLPSGGAKRALYEQIKNTLEYNSYDVYTLKNSGSEDFLDLSEIVENNYRYEFKDSKSEIMPDFLKQILRLKNISKTQKEIARIIDSKNYDLVYIAHCMYTQSPMILSYLKSKTLYYVQEPRRNTFDPEMKIEFRIHFNPFVTLKSLIAYLLNKIYAIIDKKNITRADLLICNSQFSKKNIKYCYGLKSKVCYLGINTSQFKMAKVKKEAMVISVGAAHPIKGHLDVLNAIGMISESARPILNIVYDRKSDEYIKKIKKDSIIKKVPCIFNQNISDKDLVDLYRKATFSVSAAHNEPFGFSPLESVACGTPVIARYEGGFKETVVEGKNGLFYDGTSKDLAIKMEMIMNKELKFDSVKESKKVKKNWSWNKSVENLQKFFIEVYEK